MSLAKLSLTEDNVVQRKHHHSSRNDVQKLSIQSPITGCDALSNINREQIDNNGMQVQGVPVYLGAWQGCH